MLKQERLPTGVFPRQHAQFMTAETGGGTYTLSSSVESAYILRTNLPSSVPFDTAINGANRTVPETTQSWDMNAYTNLEGVGVKLLLSVSGNHADKQHLTD